VIDVLGQPDTTRRLKLAAEQPVPAYLFLGPDGSGKRSAAAQFAGELFARSRPDDAARHRRLAVGEQHPDLVIVERAGATISTEQTREVVRLTALSPVDAGCKVIVLDEFHLVGDQTAMVLKAIEEPPPSTFFFVLASDVPPELVTIASRCVTIAFSALAVDVVVSALVGDGVDPELAREAANAAGGDIGRARLLATDHDLAERLRAWRAVPDRLDDSGYQVMLAVTELLEMIDSAGTPLADQHETELERLETEAEAMGTKVIGRRDIDTRHKREARRLRSDELRLGLATLGQRYRDDLVAGRCDPLTAAAAIEVLTSTSSSLARNPNERLLLADAFCRLPAQ